MFISVQKDWETEVEWEYFTDFAPLFEVFLYVYLGRSGLSATSF